MTGVGLGAFILLLLNIVPIDGERWEPADSLSGERIIRPGGAYVVCFDPRTQSLQDTIIGGPDLSAIARRAVEAAPGWLRRPLSDNLLRLDATHQKEYAELILSVPEPRCLDEVCFTVAHLSPQTLDVMDPAIVDTNVIQMHRLDEHLRYVNIVDFGSDSSTTEYCFVHDSDTTWVRIPAEVYYWYVMMPKLIMERPRMDAAACGRFWRDYLWNAAVTDTSPGRDLQLRDVLPLAKVLWDGHSHTWENRNRFDSTQCALEILGKWVGKAVPRGNPPENRPNQPNVIATNHKGTCSELRMLLAAAGRTGLIPIVGTWNWNENHHWNEVWWAGAWHPYQVDYWHGPTNVDNPGVASDKEYGGGKQLSLVWNERADGYQESVVGLFSNADTISVRVVDASDEPVDGSRVTLWSRAFEDSNPSPTIGLADGVTDRDGRFTFLVGDWQDYYLSLESPLGKIPPSGYTQIVDSSDAMPGRRFTRDLSLDGKMPELRTVKMPPVKQGEWRIVTNVLPGEEYVYGYNGFHASDGELYHEEDPCSYRVEGRPAAIDFLVTDSTGFARYLKKKGFQVFSNRQNATALEDTSYVPRGRKCYFIFSNERRLNTAEVLPIRVQVYRRTLPKAQHRQHPSEDGKH